MSLKTFFSKENKKNRKEFFWKIFRWSLAIVLIVLTFMYSGILSGLFLTIIIGGIFFIGRALKDFKIFNP